MADQSSAEFGSTKESIKGIQRVLQTTLDGRPVAGTVDINEIVSAFEGDRGEGFQHSDGYYSLTGLRNPSEGNLVRVKTTPDGRTLWYPTSVRDLSEVVTTSAREIKRFAGDPLLDAYFADRDTLPPGADINVLLAEEEANALGRYQIVDFGSGDGRLPMIASAYGMPSVGIELDEELLGMAHSNIAKAGREGFLRAPTEIVEGSFFDEHVLNRVFSRPQTPNTVCYLYVTPYTWDLVPRILPHLKTNDILVTYKEKLSRNPHYSEIADRVKRKNEYFMMEPPINTYTLK